MLAFLSSSPNIPGVAFSLDSSIFTAWLLQEEQQEEVGRGGGGEGGQCDPAVVKLLLYHLVWCLYCEKEKHRKWMCSARQPDTK